VLAATSLYGGYRFLLPKPSRVLEPVDSLARRFYVSLDDEQRRRYRHLYPDVKQKAIADVFG
jgi:hypothetical protein